MGNVSVSGHLINLAMLEWKVAHSFEAKGRSVSPDMSKNHAEQLMAVIFHSPPPTFPACV